VDTDEINKAKDHADTVKKDAKVKANKKLKNEEKKANNPKSMMDEAPTQRVIHVTDKSGKKTDIQVKPNVGDATLLDMIAATRKKFPNHKLGYSVDGMEEPLGADEGQGIPENMEMDQTDKLKEEDSAKVIGDIVKIASGPMKELPHGNDLHKVIDVQDGKLLIQPWDQETEKPFPLKNIKYPHSAVLVDAADITSHDLLGMDIRLKEEDGPDSDPAHKLSGPGILTMPVQLSAAKTRGEQRAVLQVIANDPKDKFAPTAKRLLSKLFGIKEEDEGDDQYPVHNGEQNEEDDEEDDDPLTRPTTH